MLKDFTIANLLDLNETIAKDLFEGKTYPWEVLPESGGLILKLGQTLSEEESNAKYDKMFAEILSEMKNTDRTMDVELVKENSEWKVKNENDLVKLILNIDSEAINQIQK